MRQTKLIFSIAALAIAIAGCTDSATVAPDPKEIAVAKEVEARQAISSILFDQQTYYIENRTFTTSAKDMETMDARVESSDYVYRILPKPSKDKGIAVTATAKRPELRSFTGVVFALRAGEQKLTISEICETTQPSKQAPLVPSAPHRPTDPIQCPAGSRSSLAYLALQ